MEKPYLGNATIEDTMHGVQISIPAKKNWFVILFLAFWLCGWAAGEIFVTSVLINGFTSSDEDSAGGGGIFMLVWLALWTFGGFTAIRLWIWMLRGKEILTFERGTLLVQKVGYLFGKDKEYDIKEMKKLRAQDVSFNQARRSSRGIGFMGVIAFDYGMKTIRIGEGIDEAEGNYLIEKLVEKKILKEENL